MLQPKDRKKLDDLLQLCGRSIPGVEEGLIRRAFEFGMNAHRNDKRASGEPFFDHPYEVAKILAREIPLDDVSVASALLHDVAEDTEYQIKDIRAEFGDAVADIVDGATKISDIFKTHEVTQAESYGKMLLSMVNDVRVMLIKFADRLHNMRTLEYLDPEKQKRLARETLDIYAPFAHRFGLANIKWELEDLSFKYLHRDSYNMIARELKSRRREREAYVKRFAEPIGKRLRAEGHRFEIAGRPKHLYSIYKKMSQRGKPLAEIYDLFAVRIILDTEDSNACFSVYGVVADIYKPNPERFKNYISVPKKNGYQSIHTTVVGPDGKMVEVQIRTRRMHEVAERGVAAHWMYKEGRQKVDAELSQWVNWVREVLENAAEGQVPAAQVMESFKLNLYQDEIYVFTPKGDLKKLPTGATPVDFAYEIHSKVGDHCLAAKVNGRIVPLDAQLRSGDQVEILTSRNQTPNPDWEKFAITLKAKSHIRRWVREEQRKAIEEGRTLWERRTRKAKVSVREEDLQLFLQEMKIENLGMFYLAIRQEKIDPDTAIQLLVERQKHPQAQIPAEGQIEGLFTRFVTSARGLAEGIVLEGSRDSFLHNFARCCNPVPGDDIVGFVTRGEGIRIHRRGCRNIRLMMKMENQRVMEVSWPSSNGVLFVAGVRVAGQDRRGMLSDITHAIAGTQSTSIRSVNIDSGDGVFSGTFILYVRDTEHLQRVMEKIRRVSGVTRAERFEE
ncbi:MAG: bifunctional (p)ppGpp synthetase/guanosine-3',5'-bis(diphosphate) 3'-pyrophosphohydrolase [Bacteroidota bacterium]